MCCIISLCPRIWKSRVLCLGVACGTLKIGFFGRFCGYSCAMLGSTVDTCSAPVLGAFGRILHIVYESDPEVFSLRTHAEWRSVLSRCFTSQSWYASPSLSWLHSVFVRLPSAVSSSESLWFAFSSSPLSSFLLVCVFSLYFLFLDDEAKHFPLSRSCHSFMFL